MAQVFLSYSRKDLTFRDRVVSDLDSEGIDVWIDDLGLAPGDLSWRMAIEQAIENADCTVVLMSPSAKKSVEVRKEISYSEVQGKRVIPVLIAGEIRTAAPSNLIEAQYIDLRTQYEDNFQKLVIALRNLVDVSGAQEKGQTAETPSFLPSNWPADSDTNATDLVKNALYQSFPLPKKVPPLPKERERLKEEILSALISFRLKGIESEDLKIGQIEIQQLLKSYLLTLKLPDGISQSKKQTIIDGLGKLGFVAAAGFPSFSYQQTVTGVYTKLWNEPDSNAGQIADDIIEANLILGLSLDNIQIESST